MIEDLKNIVEEVISEQPEFFCVNCEVIPKNNYKVYLDGDQGITIQQCAIFNKAINKKLILLDFFAQQNYSLEVSSPGAENPLLFPRQYKKHLLRNLKIELKEEPLTTVEGKLLQIFNDYVLIEITTGKGHKKLISTQEIPFNNINKTTVQLQF
ncbi:MAG: hypothetical protein ORN85_08195 [Sediminibacterium sp.]|nr:hypothetical protein [Sediminibacterium sp.]